MIRRKYENRRLVFETKLIKYSKLIEALQDAVSDSSEKVKQNVVSAQKQVELIGAKEVISLSEKFYTSTDMAFVKHHLKGPTKPQHKGPTKKGQNSVSNGLYF